jgi:hypothetical protein
MYTGRKIGDYCWVITQRVVNRQVLKKATEPAWLAQELKPNRKLFPNYLPSIFHGLLKVLVHSMLGSISVVAAPSSIQHIGSLQTRIGGGGDSPIVDNNEFCPSSPITKLLWQLL